MINQQYHHSHSVVSLKPRHHHYIHPRTMYHQTALPPTYHHHRHYQQQQTLLTPSVHQLETPPQSRTSTCSSPPNDDPQHQSSSHSMVVKMIDDNANKCNQQRGLIVDDDDVETEEAANFLLTLKHSSVGNMDEYQHHRSVTPEPQLQPQEQVQASSSSCLEGEICSFSLAGSSSTPINWTALIGDSPLVHMKDRSLVPDALFVAMAQMKPCQLTEADKVGCYKSRELGFVGMCCKHCNGQPGFGRYYPNSVRSLAQTTTSQTILKHIGSKCRFCPSEIRQLVNDLQHQQQQNQQHQPSSSDAKANATAGAGEKKGPTTRPRYGSRKIFFQRIWARLHHGVGRPLEEEEENSVDHHCDGDSCDSTTSQQQQQEAEEEPKLKKTAKRLFHKLPIVNMAMKRKASNSTADVHFGSCNPISSSSKSTSSSSYLFSSSNNNNMKRKRARLQQ